MKGTLVMVSLIMLAPRVAAAATPPIPVAAARPVFTRAHALCSADGARLWGASLCGPLMLADPRTHAAIANVPVPGAERRGAYYRFTLPAGAPIANAPFQYKGIRFAQITWPLPRNREEQAVNLMHESFHRIQPTLGFVVHGARSADITISGDAALDTQTGRIWLRGEMHALRVALTSGGAARRKALANALELRAYRHAILPSTAVPEHELDIMEGLAESTGIDVGLPRSRRIAYTLHDMKFVEHAPSYARTFFFAIGPAYSELLDAAQPNWRHEVTMKTSIAALAARAYRITVVTPTAAQAQSILSRYGGAKIEREEVARHARQVARDAGYRAELVAGRTLRAPLRHFKIGFNPSDVEHLGPYGSVYHRVMVSAPWGRLVVSHGDALIDGSFSAITVAAPSSPIGRTLHGRGWVLRLSRDAKLIPNPHKPGSYTVRAQSTAAH